MHIVVIAWLYVAFMMAITETSAVAGVMTFLFYGLLPAGILFYLAGGARRRKRRKTDDVAGRDARAPSSREEATPEGKKDD